MKNKNWFVRALCMMVVFVLTAGILTGCNKAASDKDEQGRTILSVGDWPSKNGKELDNINARKTRFEEANTDVVIQPDFWSFDGKTFYAKAAGGQLPTYFGARFTEMAEIISSEYSADLTDALSKHGYDGMINENILEVVSDENGRVRAFPYTAYIFGLAFNTKMMDAAGLMEADGTPKQPKDWYEVAEFAVKIKEATGKPGIVFPTSNKQGGWMFTPVAWSFGVDFMEKNKDGKWMATFDTPEAVEALQYIKDLRWKYDVLPKNTLIDFEEHKKIFGVGDAGMTIGGGTLHGSLVQYGMKPDDFGMMAMPAGPKRHVTLLGGAVYCVKSEATEDQIDAALRWNETLYNFKLTEEFKTNKTKSIEEALAKNQLVGIKTMSVWSENSEALKWEYEQLEEKANSNPNHVKLYNEFVTNCPCEIQAEEPVCAQELYEILDGCIQEVLTDENADCASIIKGAASDFQANCLDNL